MVVSGGQKKHGLFDDAWDKDALQGKVWSGWKGASVRFTQAEKVWTSPPSLQSGTKTLIFRAILFGQPGVHA